MSPVRIHTVEHGDPSPIPENNWLWRRVYVFAVTAALCAHVAFTALRTDDVQTLRETIRNDQYLILLYALLYLAGASTEAIARVLATVRTTRKETVTETTAAPAPPAEPAPPPTVPDAPSWSRG